MRPRLVALLAGALAAGGLGLAAPPGQSPAGSAGPPVAPVQAAAGFAPRTPAVSAEGCRFGGTMATLAALQPDEVGACLADASPAPESGDDRQPTGGGLLVRRHDDGRTAFTDGVRTWLIGPYGVATRLNTERFPWEPNPE